MTAFVIYQGEVLDQARYDEYIVRARQSILAAGGRFVARGVAADVLEGDAPPGPTVVLEFPTKQAAIDWYRSSAYQEVKKIRDGAALARMFVIDGLP